MARRSKPLSDVMASYYQDDAYVAGLIESILSDKDPELLNLALKKLAEARGVSVEAMATRLNISVRTIYHALSRKGNPSYRLVAKIADVLGFQLTLVPKSNEPPVEGLGRLKEVRP